MNTDILFDIIGISLVMMTPMFGIAWAIYYSWVYSKDIGNEIE